MLNPLWAELSRRAAAEPQAMLMESGEQRVAVGEFHSRVQRLASRIRQLRVSSLALWADNGPDWAVIDLACQLAGVRLLPLPPFFSARQTRHVLRAADGILRDRFLTPPPGVGTGPGRDLLEGRLPGLVLEKLPPGTRQAPRGTGKITFTSGSTGEPRGVCLSTDHQMQVAGSLARVLNLPGVRHLCVLPLSTLLENVAGLYAPLLSRGQVVVPSLAELGMGGSSSVDLKALTSAVQRYRPQSMILVPELLRALVAAAASGWQPPDSLCFMAVGGARVAVRLIEQARALGLPVYEGYGLSECGSVVCLNRPGRDRPGTAGTPLPHVRLSCEQGELRVAGSAFLGYLDKPDDWYPRTVNTGDLGFVDDQGFVRVDGRRDNRLISSYGRNISPEWVEGELLAGPLLTQAVVVGDGRPFCSALLYPGSVDIGDASIQDWIAAVNARLPDYARIGKWWRLEQPLRFADGLLTANGRPRRDAIMQCFSAVIEALYVSDQEIAQT